MDFLAKQNEVIFLGQAVRYPGTAMSNTLKSVPKEKLIELPVFEEVQLGMSLGMAVDGMLPISCFPRFDFLLCAMNQLINHADKIKIITNNQYNPSMIIRVLVGAKKPLNGGEQHTQNYVNELKTMLKTIKVWDLKDEKKILLSYKEAFNNKRINLMVEYSQLY